MNDIEAMKCGELTRIMNHLHRQYQKDNERCTNDRAKYVEYMNQQHMAAGDEFATQLTMQDEDGDDNEEDGNTAKQQRLRRNKSEMKNPGLAFKHLSKHKWTR